MIEHPYSTEEFEQRQAAAAAEYAARQARKKAEREAFRNRRTWGLARRHARKLARAERDETGDQQQ